MDADIVFGVWSVIALFCAVGSILSWIWKKIRSVITKEPWKFWKTAQERKYGFYEMLAACFVVGGVAVFAYLILTGK